MRCKECGVVFKKPNQNPNVRRCWSEFDMCLTCATIKYPEKFSKSSRLATLAKAGKYKSPKKVNRKDGRTRVHVVGGVK